ncbi:MAG: hypothetical protein G01um101477_640, partial [Candidatus Doudnabacteria bacterium Gr01-1014_77]
CGVKLIVRKDNTEEAINKRLDQYETDTLPGVDFLRDHTKLVEIDGNQIIPKVTSDINQALGI